MASGDLPTAGLRKVDAVLRSDRETWKLVHPAETFAAKTDVTFPADMSLAAGASVLRTLCWAGYRDVTVHAGPLTIAFQQWVKRLPSGSESEVDPWSFVVSLRGDGKVDVRFDSTKMLGDGPFLPKQPSSAPNQTLTDLTTVTEFLADACATRGELCVQAISIRADEPSILVVLKAAQVFGVRFPLPVQSQSSLGEFLENKIRF